MTFRRSIVEQALSPFNFMATGDSLPRPNYHYAAGPLRRHGSKVERLWLLNRVGRLDLASRNQLLGAQAILEGGLERKLPFLP